jgi:hypothetical protein
MSHPPMMEYYRNIIGMSNRPYVMFCLYEYFRNEQPAMFIAAIKVEGPDSNPGLGMFPLQILSFVLTKEELAICPKRNYPPSRILS